MSEMQTAALAAVDWGTTHLRVTILNAEGAVLDKRESSKGMGSLTPDVFEPALLELIEDYLTEGSVLPVLCCGMVGAKQGWVEAPYVKTPCKASGAPGPVQAPVNDPRLQVWILPGIAQSAPADVMRGEETQIAGFLAQFPKFDGVICLPGTHSKWVRISAEEIVSFQTFMTGELFSLLSENSVLKHSLQTKAIDLAAFQAAVSDAMSRPQSVAAKLFGIRADALVHGLAPEVARARLSGTLLGLELAGARPYWLGMDIVLIGDPALCELYQEALSAQGAPARVHNGTGLSVAGLSAAFKAMKDRV